MRRLYYDIQRFTYWDYQSINPHYDSLSRPYKDINNITHNDLSDEYQEKFEKGNEEAVFEFVESDAQAFESNWVGKQIAKWRISGKPEDKKKIEKLFTDYLDDRGKRRNLKEIIKRDQGIFKRIKELQKDGKPLRNSRSGDDIFSIVQEELKVGQENIKEVYDRYRKKENELKEKGLIDSENDFFEWLDKCYKRL